MYSYVIYMPNPSEQNILPKRSLSSRILLHAIPKNSLYLLAYAWELYQQKDTAPAHEQSGYRVWYPTIRKSQHVKDFLWNHWPVHIPLSHLLELLPHNGILRLYALGVLFQHTFGYLAHILEELAVFGYVSYLQVESNPTLLGTFQITGTAQLQVGFCNFETVSRLHTCLTAPLLPLR